MKLSEVCALITTDGILLYDKSIRKVIDVNCPNAREVINQIYGDRIVESILPTGLMQMSITIV